jgi:Flp pilus assembly protein TadD
LENKGSRKGSEINRARRPLRTALKFRPGDTNLHYNLGVALARVGSIEQAVNQFRKALSIDPNHGPASAALQAEPTRVDSLQDK